MGVIALELFSTTLETGIVMWLFGSNWNLWGIGLKISTPLLHILFTIAQLWGSYVIWQLARVQKNRMKEAEALGKEVSESVCVTTTARKFVKL